MKKILQIFPLLVLIFSLSACASSSNVEFSSPVEQTGETAISDQQTSFSGDFTVLGYPIVQNIHESFCEDRDCPVYRYVTFAITSVKSGELPMTRVGLGCLENSVIRYSNDSDEHGIIEKELSENLSNAIMTSTREAPIALHMVKLPVSTGRIAPTCSSEFTLIEAAQN